jgi:hypothetical protein
MNCTNDLCPCGVTANQIDLDKSSNDELAMFTALLNKVRLNKEEKNNG